MKHMFTLVALVAIACVLTACGGAAQSTLPSSPGSTAAEPGYAAQEDTSRILVAFFSATGNTQHVAEDIQAITGAVLCPIVPQTPYTQADLDYSNDECRANREQNDPTARPAMADMPEEMAQYDVIFLGYPIWWGQAPKIIDTFLESESFDGKVIIPFCTSGSSGIDASIEPLQALAQNATWMEGHRFGADATQQEIAEWVESLDLAALPA